jgi:hypothetical protein
MRVRSEGARVCVGGVVHGVGGVVHVLDMTLRDGGVCGSCKIVWRGR